MNIQPIKARCKGTRFKETRFKGTGKGVIRSNVREILKTKSWKEKFKPFSYKNCLKRLVDFLPLEINSRLKSRNLFWNWKKKILWQSKSKIVC